MTIEVVVVVELTETSPLAELLAVGDLDQRDLVLAAKSDDELLVGLLLACLVEHAHVSLATVKGLGGLTETAGKSVVDQRDLQDTLEGVENGHAAARLAVVGSDLDFDFFGRGDRGRGLFYIRLRKNKSAIRFFSCHLIVRLLQGLLCWVSRVAPDMLKNIAKEVMFCAPAGV